MSNENDKVKEALKGETSGFEKALEGKAVTKTPETPKGKETVTEKVTKEMKASVEEEEEPQESKNVSAADVGPIATPDENLVVNNSEEFDLEAVMEFLSAKGMTVSESNETTKDAKEGLSRPISGTVIGTAITLKRDFKGDTANHVMNSTADIVRKLRKEGVLQINSVVIGDEVHSRLVYN